MGSDSTASDLLDRGIRLLDAGHYTESVRNLRSSFDIDPSSAQCLSYLGLAIALGEKNYREAEEFCREAIRKQFYQSEFYHNLGLVHLASKQRGLAVRALRKGLKIDPDNEEIQDTLEQIGTRSRPLLAFLSRDHILNHKLGKIAAQYFGRHRRKR